MHWGVVEDMNAWFPSASIEFLHLDLLECKGIVARVV
jgi:hypothetical protein